MKCRYCKKEFEDSRDCLLKKNNLFVCSDLCKSREKAEKRKARLAKLSDRVCQHPRCSNKIISASKHTKTCSKECGSSLRVLSKAKYFSGGSDMNSSSNDLIRLVNKFLQMPIS